MPDEIEKNITKPTILEIDVSSPMVVGNSW